MKAESAQVVSCYVYNNAAPPKKTAQPSFKNPLTPN